MKLKDIQVRNAKAKEKPYKLSDGNGLSLYISTTGGKYWRYNYRFNGKYKTFTIGKYPSISLVEARARHRIAHQGVQDGVDPSQQRKLDKVKQTETFEKVTWEWIAAQKNNWSESYYVDLVARFKNHVFPYIGDRPFADIEAPELLQVIRRMEAKGITHSTRKVRNNSSQIFRFGIASGYCKRDPAADLSYALKVETPKHYATITDPQKLGSLLRAIDGYEGQALTRYALQIAPYVFVRPFTLRSTEWSELDLDNALWVIPASKMKLRRKDKDALVNAKNHTVPLSTHVVSVLRQVEVITGGQKYVFPSTRSTSRPMSENTLNAALRRMGYTKEEITTHGFRHTASTLLNELGYNPDWVEAQLAHKDGSIRGVYNKADYDKGRKHMMQEWSDYLDGLKNGADIVPLFGNGGVK